MEFEYINAPSEMERAVAAAKARMELQLAELASRQASVKKKSVSLTHSLHARLDRLADQMAYSIKDRTAHIATMLQAQAFNGQHYN